LILTNRKPLNESMLVMMTLLNISLIDLPPLLMSSGAMQKNSSGKIRLSSVTTRLFSLKTGLLRKDSSDVTAILTHSKQQLWVTFFNDETTRSTVTLLNELTGAWPNRGHISMRCVLGLARGTYIKNP